jgi:hypothetical protein
VPVLRSVVRGGGVDKEVSTGVLVTAVVLAISVDSASFSEDGVSVVPGSLSDSATVSGNKEVRSAAVLVP